MKKKSSAHVYRLPVLFLLLTLSPLFLQGVDHGPNIRLLTIGQGDPVYIWFGHTSLAVEDHVRGSSRVYDYGVFDFLQENFFLNFAMGRLIYSKISNPTQYQIQAAARDRRNLRIITLDLPLEARIKTASFLEQEVLPGNNTYLYHHYYDNCSTRIRDIIDDATGGQFRQWAQAQEGRMTLRDHFSRHSRDSFFMLWLLNFLQGPSIDIPITRWDDMFLPLELEQAVLDFSYTNAQGILVPLAASHITVTEFEQRPKVPYLWEPLWPLGLLIGTLAMLVMALIIRKLYRSIRYKTNPGIRIYGISQAVLGLIFGIMGTILLFMMLFTNHDVTKGNLNVLMVNPLWLASVYFGISIAKGKIRHLRSIILLWRSVSVLSVVGVILRMLMEYPQGNQLTMAILLPLIFLQGQWWLLFKRPDYMNKLL